MTKTGTVSESAKGSYTVTFTLNDTTNYQWADNTSTPYSIVWSIGASAIAKPTLSGTTSFTYDGNAKTVTVNGYNSETMTFSGTISETSAGNYTAIYSLKDKTNYAWEGGSTEDVILHWSIAPKKLTAAQSNLSCKITTRTVTVGQYSNTGKLIGFLDCSGDDINNFNATYHTITRKSKTAGAYQTDGLWYHSLNLPYEDQFIVGLKPNYTWHDGSTEPKTFPVTVTALKIPKPTASTTSFTYDGNTKTLTVNNYNSTYMTQSSGYTSGVNVGDYSVTYALRDYYGTSKNITPYVVWSDDNTDDDVTLNWQITAGNGIAKPTLSTTEYEWSGGNISPNVSGYNSAVMNQGGNFTASAIGTYNVTYSLKDKINTKWADGTTADITLTWKIVRQKLAYDLAIDTSKITYNGSVQEPKFIYGNVQWTLANLSQYCDLSSQTSAVDAGTYRITATPKATYAWQNGTYSAKSFNWSIKKAQVENICNFITNTNQYYDGTQKSPSMPVYDTSIITEHPTKSTSSAVDVGNYTIRFALIDPNNYEWIGSYSTLSDGTVCVSRTWHIKVATSTLSLSDDSVTLSNSYSQTTLTITYTGDGTLTVTSSNTETAIVSISGRTLTVKVSSYNTETATVTVSAAATANTSAASATLSATSSYIPPFGSCNWTQIQQIVKAGRASEQWTAGDFKNFSMSVNYRVSTASTSVNDWTYYKAILLGINHLPEYERTSSVSNYIDCMILSRDNTPILLDPNTYDTQPDSNVNYGAYSFRYGEESNLYQYLPSDLKAVIVAATKHRQYGSSAILYTAQTLWGLSVGEINAGNDFYDQTWVYEYFANGNPIQLFTYPAEAPTTQRFWTRDTDQTRYQDYGLVFYPRVNRYEAVNKNTALAIVPCFRIGG